MNIIQGDAEETGKIHSSREGQDKSSACPCEEANLILERVCLERGGRDVREGEKREGAAQIEIHCEDVLRGANAYFFTFMMNNGLMSYVVADFSF